jgi:phosphohistidine swiveling domain-containing protein
MARLYVDSDKFGSGNRSATVEAFHNAVKDLVRRRLDETGGDWESFVFGKSFAAVTAADFVSVERLLLDAGHRFDWSAAISPRERPEAYKAAEGVSEEDIATFSFEHPEAQVAEADAEGREQRGQGDNVAQYPEPVTGTARYIRSPALVIKYLTEGVPEDTIAIIDDSGGTLTAPILERFRGVICAGGSTRSHLGILTREYGVPCLMNAKVSGIREGDRVMFDCTARPRTAEDYQQGREATAKVWRLPRAAQAAAE